MNIVKVESLGLIDKINLTEDELAYVFHSATSLAADHVGAKTMASAFSKLLIKKSL